MKDGRIRRPLLGRERWCESHAGGDSVSRPGEDGNRRVAYELEDLAAVLLYNRGQYRVVAVEPRPHALHAQAPHGL